MRNAKLTILEAVKDYQVRHGKRPTTIFVDHELEHRLAELTRSDVGDLVGEMVVAGPRKAFEKGILGMAVEWGADTFRVE